MPGKQIVNPLAQMAMNTQFNELVTQLKTNLTIPNMPVHEINLTWQDVDMENIARDMHSAMTAVFSDLHSPRTSQKDSLLIEIGEKLAGHKRVRHWLDHLWKITKLDENEKSWFKKWAEEKTKKWEEKTKKWEEKMQNFGFQ